MSESMLTRGVGWGTRETRREYGRIAALVSFSDSDRSKDASTDKGDHGDLASLVQIRINLNRISLIVSKVSLGSERSTAIVDST